MLTSTATLVDRAQARRMPVLAFNVITLEHAEAITLAAERVQQAVILQISENAVKYHGDAAPLLAACRKIAENTTAAVSLHLDHVESPDLLHAAPALGVSSVMFDASPLGDEQNMEQTRRASDWAHARDLFVEAELGAIGGKGNAHTPGVRTDPAAAAMFVERTGVDALAVAVGSSHAMTSRSGELDQALICKIAQVVPVPLVLHGSSGIPDAALREAAVNGIVKINVGTLLNVAFTRAVQVELEHNASAVDPRKYLAKARMATEDAVAGLLTALGPAGISPTPAAAT